VTQPNSPPDVVVDLDPVTGEITQINDFAVNTRLIESPDIGEFLPAFIAAKLEFGKVLKSVENTFFNSKYADLKSVLEAVDPSLGKHGLVLMQPTVINQYGVNLLFTRILHVSKQWMGSIWRLTPVKSDPQGEGSALTYARRQQAQTLLGVAAEDDDGTAASAPAAQSSGRDWVAEAKAIAATEGRSAGERRGALIALMAKAEQAGESPPTVAKEFIAIGKALKVEIDAASAAAADKPPGDAAPAPDKPPETGWPETAKPGSAT
jgi:hypothetical protein